jgi:F420-dependent oxidoreductase-like protein
MRLSIWPNAAATWDNLLATATHAEQTGWDGVWMADHFMPASGDPQGPINEALAYVAGLAAAVPRLRLGTLVCGNTYRHPAVLAKQAATIDNISGGRLILGLGAGWQEREHAAYGIPFHTVKERLDMFEEACQLVKALTTEELADFDGRYYQLHDAPLSPRPVQGTLPLLVGGGGEKRTLRIAAKYADEWNCWGTPEVLTHKMAVLDRHCEEVGRDPSTIQRSGQVLLFMSDNPSFLARVRDLELPNPAAIGTPAEIGDTLHAYAEAGLDEFVVNDAAFRADGAARFDSMDRIREVATAATTGR